MKSKIIKLISFFMITILLTGCNNNTKEITKGGNTKYHKKFGSYEVLNGWVESKTHSTNNKYFYVKKGDDNKSRPNNVSINQGKNKYSSSEHVKFRSAITSQLMEQISKKQGVNLGAKGSHTKKGYTLYTFTIKEDDSNTVTSLCYIVGDYKYVLVQETNYDDDNETFEVTKNIINTFEWNN